jgi:hypothetical protein
MVVAATMAQTHRDSASAAVINTNQHRFDVESCNDPQGAPYPPFWNLAQDSRISLSAYHLRPNEPGLFETARCLRNVQKPRIYDDDAGFTSLTEPKSWILAICNDVRNDPDLIGREHYEHWASSLTEKALRGELVGGFNTWPAGGLAREMATWISNPIQGCATTLDPNGTLDVSPASGGDQRVVRWNGSPATLIGFGHMGALAAGDRTLLVKSGTQDGYLGSIRKYRANLVRIWAIEQWTGKAICQTDPNVEGLTPFSGSFQTYDLSIDGLNPLFFQRLREFSQLAADRGIVTQISLFDRAGLINPPCKGQWLHSPYNKEANHPDINFLNGSSMSSCGCGNPCTPGADPFFWEEEPTACTTFDGMLNDSSIRPIHNAYIRRMAQEIGGIGNVIFEIINEMNKFAHWTAIGEAWQGDYVACQLSKELPTFTTRDAFNAGGPGQGLNAKAPDAGTGTWTAANALVQRTQDPETLIQMGALRGRPDATVSLMRGALALGTSPNRHELGVRANVGFTGGSNMSLGFSSISNPASASANLLRVELGQTMLMAACKRVAIVKKTGGTTQQLGSTCVLVPEGAEVQFLVDVVAAKGKVLVDGHIVLDDVALGTLPSSLAFAYFHGWKASGPYRETDGFVDNFEANIYYRDPNISCPFPT